MFWLIDKILVVLERRLGIVFVKSGDELYT